MIKQWGSLKSVDFEEMNNLYIENPWDAVFCKLCAKIVRMVKERTLKKGYNDVFRVQLIKLNNIIACLGTLAAKIINTIL